MVFMNFLHPFFNMRPSLSMMLGEGLFCVVGGHSFGYALQSSSVTSTT